MRLINTTTGLFTDFADVEQSPPYAILSHTWTDHEVSYKDYRKGRNKSFSGYAKIKSTLELARSDGLEYAWIDTCCIDKESSAELSLAINSMYQWYEHSRVCYVHLADIDIDTTSSEQDIGQSRW